MSDLKAFLFPEGWEPFAGRVKKIIAHNLDPLLLSETANTPLPGGWELAPQRDSRILIGKWDQQGSMLGFAALEFGWRRKWTVYGPNGSRIKSKKHYDRPGWAKAILTDFFEALS